MDLLFGGSSTKKSSFKRTSYEQIALRQRREDGLWGYTALTSKPNRKDLQAAPSKEISTPVWTQGMDNSVCFHSISNSVFVLAFDVCHIRLSYTVLLALTLRSLSRVEFGVVDEVSGFFHLGFAACWGVSIGSVIWSSSAWFSSILALLINSNTFSVGSACAISSSVASWVAISCWSWPVNTSKGCQLHFIKLFDQTNQFRFQVALLHLAYSLLDSPFWQHPHFSWSNTCIDPWFDP